MSPFEESGGWILLSLRSPWPSQPPAPWPIELSLVGQGAWLQQAGGLGKGMPSSQPPALMATAPDTETSSHRTHRTDNLKATPFPGITQATLGMAPAQSTMLQQPPPTCTPTKREGCQPLDTYQSLHASTLMPQLPAAGSLAPPSLSPGPVRLHAKPLVSPLPMVPGSMLPAFHPAPSALVPPNGPADPHARVQQE